MNSNQMPCRNTVALARHEAAMARAESDHDLAEQAAVEDSLNDEQMIAEMVWDQQGQSADDEELALLILKAGVDHFTSGLAEDSDRIVDLLKSRGWFQRAVDRRVGR